MPFPLATVLLVTALMSGCTAQRGTADSPATTSDDPAMADTTNPAMQGGPGGMPNIAVYLDGTWDMTLTPRDGGAPITGAWTVHEEGENAFRGLAGMDAPVEVTGRTLTADIFFVSGVADAARGPLPFEVSGTLNGNAMRGEVMIEGMGRFDMTGTRHVE